MNEIGLSGFFADYKAYPITVPELKAGEYFWVAPPGNGNAVDAVYVDRIVIQKAE
jgi:hypothetical protein